MRRVVLASFVAVLLPWSSALGAQEAPAPPPRPEGYEWLRGLVGQWEAEVEVVSQPGQPPLKVTSTESIRPIGGRWILSEGETTSAAMPFARALILGYDAAKEKYVGTWVDTNSTHIGVYEGTLDAAGAVLTLEGELPHPHDGVRKVKVREAIALKGPGHKVVTTALQGDDGAWFTLVTVEARRKE